MILSLVLALQSPATATAPADRPIRVWMDAQGSVSRGRGVRLFVQVGAAGSLVVLHSRSDGRIEVLFPARPTDDPHITPGTWEVRGKGDGPVWTVSEPDGQGMILAALTPDPVWFDEFSHAASWDPEALRPSWSGADASGGMTDIVQRMLGDGGFTYDVLTYTVVPDAIAQAPMPGAADGQVGPDTALNPPTIDNTEPDDAALTTCGVSSPVECQLLGQSLFFGHAHHRGGFGRGGPSPAAATPQMRTMAAPLVYPIRPTPVTQTAVVPGRRLVPQRFGRSKLSPAASPSAPAPESPRVRTLVSHPVAGASGRLAGAPPAARSAMVLRYVHPRSELTPSSATLATLTPASAPPRESLPVTMAGGPGGGGEPAMPMRGRSGTLGGGVSLMSRPVAGAMPEARASGAVAARPRVEARAPRGPVRGGVPVSRGWMVMPRRR